MSETYAPSEANIFMNHFEKKNVPHYQRGLFDLVRILTELSTNTNLLNLNTRSQKTNILDTEMCAKSIFSFF